MSGSLTVCGDPAGGWGGQGLTWENPPVCHLVSCSFGLAEQQELMSSSSVLEDRRMEGLFAVESFSRHSDPEWLTVNTDRGHFLF